VMLSKPTWLRGKTAFCDMVLAAAMISDDVNEKFMRGW